MSLFWCGEMYRKGERIKISAHAVSHPGSMELSSYNRSFAEFPPASSLDEMKWK